MSRKNTGRTPPQNLQNLQQVEARQLARLTSSSQLDSRTPPSVLGLRTNRTPPRVLGPRTSTPSSLQQTEAK